jgi:hypothetical protein
MDLYEECRALGLTIGPDNRFRIRNVVVLLERANENQGLRYFELKGSWTRDVVEKLKLMRAVEPTVNERVQVDGIVRRLPVRGY